MVWRVDEDGRRVRVAPELRVNTAIFILLILGFASMAIWAKPFAARTMAAQNRTWGFHFGEREVRGTIWMARFVGITGIVLGVWGLAVSRG
jgi:hypothetical protein